MEYVISRHKATQEHPLFTGMKLITHADEAFFECLRPGDIVTGTLPINLAERVCRAEAVYLHLTLTIPAELRGVELTPEQLESCNPCLEQFCIIAIAPPTELIECNDKRCCGSWRKRNVIVPTNGTPYLFRGKPTRHVRIATESYTKQGKWSHYTYQIELKNARFVRISSDQESFTNTAEEMAQLLGCTIDQAWTFAKRHMPNESESWKKRSEFGTSEF